MIKEKRVRIMFYMISGGSGSGKSEFAENIILKLSRKEEKRIYIATMMAFDEEAKSKIARHRQMRNEKHFTTIECFTNLKKVVLPEGCTVLLDCMSNLTANEMFQENGAKENTVKEVIEGINNILEQCTNLVVVTNEIFSDGCDYDESTKDYIRKLGAINRQMAKRADTVVEVVYGIPIYHKNKYAKKGR